MHETTGQRIAFLIEELGIKKVQFAETVGVHQTYVSQMVTDKKIPSNRIIKDICEAYNVSDRWLRTGEGEMFNPESDRANDQYPPIIRAVLKTYDRLNPTEQAAFCKFLNEFVAECTGENLPPIKGESPARQPSPAEQARARGGIPLDDFNNSSQSKSS